MWRVKATIDRTNGETTVNKRAVSHYVAWAVLIASLCAPAVADSAEPARLTNLFGGLSSSTSLVLNSNDTYKTSGIAFGADWQFPVNERFSLNPFFGTDIGNVSGSTYDGWQAHHFLLGVDARWWPLAGYHMGADVAYANETLVPRGGSAGSTTGGSGLGFGVTLGSEIDIGKPDNLIIQLRYFSVPRLKVFSDTGVKFSAVRLALGYRFQGFD